VKAPQRPGYFDRAFAPLISGQVDRLTVELGDCAGLSSAERTILVESLSGVLLDVVGRLVSRVLLVELNAARLTGRQRAADPAARWDEFIDGCASIDYWHSLRGTYPTMLDRLRQVLDNRGTALLACARRFAEDRVLLPGDGELTGFRIGGDSHLGGATVNLLRRGPTTIVYKPRSLTVDAALAAVLDDLRAGLPALRIRVPPVIDRGDYGWAEHVEHRYCAGDAELRAFYTGCGHWLALMRLLNGTDLHGENLIACGPTPVVVDCETVIAPPLELPPSGLGSAHDRALAMIAASVLRIGLLPIRGTTLGWRGIDYSAIGGLPGEQVRHREPMIVDLGLDTARMGYRLADPPVLPNRPSANPELARFWPAVLDGFTELTGHLGALDRVGRLEPMLNPLRDCRIRVLRRPSEAYAEHARMLWHPAALHDEPAALRQAGDLLRAHEQNTAAAPAGAEVIAAELADLCTGDLPIFTTTPRTGRVTGPAGTPVGIGQDLLDAALHRWRRADLLLEREVIQASIVSAYLSDGWSPPPTRLPVGPPPGTDTDRCRRSLAAGLVRQLSERAIHGDDGTVTWVAPILDVTGWQVRACAPEVYNGLCGIALLLAGYRAETLAGRADPMSEVDSLLTAVLRGIRLEEDRRAADRRTGLLTPRPLPPGAYLGLGARIWTWLALDQFGPADQVRDGVDRATALAEVLPPAVAADESFEILGGMAGAVTPLLALARRTGEDRWIGLAARIGARLAESARWEDGTAQWPTQRWPRGLAGFAHGTAGIGWALARLTEVTGDFGPLADAAFNYVDTLYHSDLGGWLDAREPEPFITTAWCHGATGIGLAAADLFTRTRRDRYADMLRRAAASVWRSGMNWNHTLCHGDAGGWELLTVALRHGLAPDDVRQDLLDANLIASPSRHGVITGLAKDAYSPGLLPGSGGVIYQLLRQPANCPLPSLLLPDLA
jgi:type 2 lantibiotic biosynthesis protein LanM